MDGVVRGVWGVMVVCGVCNVPPLSKLRKSTESIPSLRLLWLRQGHTLRATHTTTDAHRKGEDNAQISPKSELCGFKGTNNHNKYVHDSM